MENTEKNNFRIKIILIILYIVFCLIGFPLIFIFPPRKFLFSEDSIDEENKKYLFKNFVSEIHDNINKKLIRNITLTKENDDCPENFETLSIQHQYYGNFTHFFGNSSFCIQRYDDNIEINFLRILEKNEQQCGANKKPCGIINKISKALLCVNEDESCPLNDVNYVMKASDTNFQLSNTGIYFSPSYDITNNNFLINDIDIIYKYRLCLEKFHRLEKTTCEFSDDDECYLEDEDTISKKVHQETPYNQILLTPPNLAENNIKNNNFLEHDYCEGAIIRKKMFYLFSKGFVNFNKEELDNFLEEFPDNITNNPLNDICERYKTEDNFEILFYYFSCILFCWSLLHLIIKILMFFLKDENILLLVNKIFFWNGLILFFFKLICGYILIARYYLFYLEFKDVYLSLENDPRDEILSEFKKMRKIFILKIIFIWIAGFIIISMELIILSFVITINHINKEEKEKMEETIDEKVLEIVKAKSIEEKEINNNEQLDGKQNKKEIKENIEENQKEIKKIQTFNPDENDEKNNNNLEEENKNNQKPFIIDGGKSSLKEEVNPYNNNIQLINLTFQIKQNEDGIIKNYELKVDLKEYFKDIQERLKEKYPELKDIEMDIFRNDSEIINKLETVEQNNIKNDTIIIVNY